MKAPTSVARLTCDEPTARRLATYLGESLDAEDTACAAFEGDDGRWHVAIHFRAAPDETGLRELITLAAGRTAANALRIEPVADSDWVAQSLAGLRPVRAGRLVVHGAHARGGLRANDIGIQIEAAPAFGTGHHGTTLGCLLAISQRDERHGGSSMSAPEPESWQSQPPACGAPTPSPAISIRSRSGPAEPMRNSTTPHR